MTDVTRAYLTLLRELESGERGIDDATHDALRWAIAQLDGRGEPPPPRTARATAKLTCDGRVVRDANPHARCGSNRIVVIERTDPARVRAWCRTCFGHARFVKVGPGQEQIAPLWGEEYSDDR